MKKYLLSFAVLLAGTSVLTSCLDDDDDSSDSRIPVIINKGVYVVNSGNEYNSIDGSLTYINADNWVTNKNAFASVNGRSLGLTANDAIIYGSKLYVAVTGANTIEVIDNNNLSAIRQLSTTRLMGDDKGKKPRHLIATAGYIFVSTFDGYVAAIDTVNYNLYKTYKVGSYPEGMTGVGQYLYVANSDYGRGNASISAINLYTGEVDELKNPLINNPVAMTADENGLYVLDYGTYDENSNQTGAGVYKIYNRQVSFLIEATAMTLVGTKIYTVNAPYRNTPVVPTYKIYDTSTGQVTSFIADGNPVTNPEAPFSPSAIAADPVRNYIYISSYDKDPDTGYAGYSIDGYLNAYDVNGKLVQKCPTGVGPTAILPNTTIVYE